MSGRLYEMGVAREPRHSFAALTCAANTARPGANYTVTMRSIFSLLSLVVTVGIGMYIYTAYLKTAAPGTNIVATQAISTSGVETDLMAIAQAERAYYAQTGSYGDLNQLTSNGVMNIARTERDGYVYSVEASSSEFTVTAHHADSPPPATGGAPLHFPTITVDQSMQVRQTD
jgi:hypothetical protein